MLPIISIARTSQMTALEAHLRARYFGANAAYEAVVAAVGCGTDASMAACEALIAEGDALTALFQAEHDHFSAEAARLDADAKRQQLLAEGRTPWQADWQLGNS